MTPETVHAVAELTTLALMFCGPLALINYYSKRERREGDPMGIGWRAIQTISITMAVPAIIVLAMEGILTKDVTGALMGSVIGFVFAPKG